MLNRFTIFLTALLSPLVLADSVVVFNEIMYHPRSGDGVEWIELHNQMGVDIDLSGWSLQGGVEFLFPNGTFIQAGSYVVVASDVQALAAETCLAHGRPRSSIHAALYVMCLLPSMSISMLEQ